MAIILDDGIGVAPRETVVQDIYGKQIPISIPIGPIGTAPVPTPIDTTPAIPEAVIDAIIQPPIVTQFDTVIDFWNLLLGSPEAKAETIVPYLPITPEAATGIQTDVIAPMVASGEWATTPTLPTGQTLPKIEWPDFSSIGKWLLVGAVAIGGLFLLGKYVGRKK